MGVQQQRHDLKEKITTVTVDYLKALENEINQDQKEVEEKESKNKGVQLDGSLRDVLSWWEMVKFQNSVQTEQIWINSSNSSFGN
jgi:hypothetical protein